MKNYPGLACPNCDEPMDDDGYGNIVCENCGYEELE